MGKQCEDTRGRIFKRRDRWRENFKNSATTARPRDARRDAPQTRETRARGEAFGASKRANARETTRDDARDDAGDAPTRKTIDAGTIDKGWRRANRRRSD